MSGNLVMKGKEMSEPTKEYYQEKAKLCEKVAYQQAERGDLGLALGNLLRMQNALEILRLEEDGKWTRK